MPEHTFPAHLHCGWRAYCRPCCNSGSLRKPIPVGDLTEMDGLPLWQPVNVLRWNVGSAVCGRPNSLGLVVPSEGRSECLIGVPEEFYCNFGKYVPLFLWIV